MSTFYEVWDDSTGNRVGEYESLADARALLRDILDTSGPSAVCDLAVLAYVPTASGEYDVTTVLEGSDFVRSQAHETSSLASPVSPIDTEQLGSKRIDRSA